ncbi:recombinase family protein [Caldibacillus sp. 210928-DFI.2.22]|uniref:recombinase family protein n=1 Tax=Caldifermentibacillus hisashii TaxID=996558 RepID=UPI001D070043|nr:recombinase family protein [Caldibacillus sp. 210928-DFI.2.22]MCB7074845.1 recombinase family protein [Caldibacillus sp. 210928-DFI.2.18]
MDTGLKWELEKRRIKIPTGKEKWSKRTIDVMLSTEKYIGVVRLLNAGEHQEYYISENNHPAIISKEQFEAVQIEKKNRSNVVKGKSGNRRRSSKYSSKKGR